MVVVKPPRDVQRKAGVDNPHIADANGIHNAINEGAQIELPKVLTPDLKTKYVNPIEVTIAPDGTTVLEKATIKLSELKPKLIAIHAKEPDRALMLKSDQGMKWGKMRSAFFDLQDIGFKGVLLKVTEKNQGERRSGS